MTETISDGGQQSDESLGALFAAASRDLSALVKSEIELAKAEIAVGVKKGAAAGAMFGTAGVLCFLALILLLISAAYGLVAAGLDPSIAFLILAAVLLLLAGALAFVGKRAVGSVQPPERTIRTTKETAAFLKSPLSGDAQSPSS
jgi:Putative Actinobacterial Holin-X, holin superfamily III